MARGVFLPSVRFDEPLNRELAKLLRDYGWPPEDKPPEEKRPTIKGELEQVVQGIPALRRAPRSQSTRKTLQTLKAANRRLRRELRDIDEDTEVRLHWALARLRWDPAHLRKALAVLDEAIDEVVAAIDKALADPGSKSRGGKPRDLEAAWLIEQVSETLTRYGVPVTNDEDGLRARVLRALWPHALPGRDAPLELKPWFKPSKSRR
jgi:hypothetical protein